MDQGRMQSTPYPLSRRAAALVAQLPESMKLRALRGEHPEVLDLLAGCWRDPHQLERTFDELLFGPARGVPKLSLQALLELTAIQQHVAPRLPRGRASVWDLAFDAVG
jgi:hypothetical protein